MNKVNFTINDHYIDISFFFFKSNETVLNYGNHYTLKIYNPLYFNLFFFFCEMYVKSINRK